MEALKQRLRYLHGPVRTITGGEVWSMHKRWIRSQGILRRLGQPNARDHTTCNHEKGGIMPEVAEIRPGSRPGKGRSTVEILFSFSDTFAEDGVWYESLMAKGLLLREGVDYNILDSKGEVTTTMSSRLTLISDIVKLAVADAFNTPTAVTPATGTVAERSWVSFMPKTESEFTDSAARSEYLAKLKTDTFVTNIPELVEAE